MANSDLANITANVIIEEFHKGLRAGIYSGMSDLRDKYQDNFKALTLISRDRKVLEDMERQFNLDCYGKLPYVHPIATLREYCDKNEASIKLYPSLTKEYLTKHGLAGAVDAIYTVMVECIPKRGCVLLWGDPDTGKSTLSAMLASIFHAHDLLQTRSNFEVVPKRPTAKYQIILYDEASIHKLFSKRNLADTKKLLERAGTTAEAKYSHATRLYQGASIFISTNKNPLGDLDTLDQDAMMARCEMVQMIKTRAASKFPFNGYQLASYLLGMYASKTRDADDCESDDSQDSELSASIEHTLLNETNLINRVPFDQQEGALAQLAKTIRRFQGTAKN